MQGEWIDTTLGELISDGDAHLQTGPFGTQLQASEYVDDGIPLIAVREIREGYIQLGKETVRLSPETLRRLPRFILEPGDIVFARKGGTDRNAIIHEHQRGWFLGSDGIRLRLSEKYDSRFFSYVVRNPTTRAWLRQNSEGTTMPSVNQEILGRIPVSIPPLDEQQIIASVLGALDDKIELNRRMNATLEAMAQAVFKEWFVDGAKEGWEEKTIGDLADVVGGSTPSTKEETYWTDGIHCWATPKDLSSLTVPVLLDTERHLSDAGLAQVGSGLLPVGTVLMSSRAPIGYIAIAEVPTAVNQGFIALKAKPGVSNLFLWQWLLHSQDEIVSRANGSTFLEISKASFRPIAVAKPPTKLMMDYDRAVRPLYERLVANEKESRTLATLRDALLPKLMRGELRVKH